MAMDGKALADEIRSAMEFPAPTSEQLISWASSVVGEVQMGIATFGAIPSPHPISGLVGPRLAAAIAKAAKYPSVSPELIKYCTALTTYIMASAFVTYVGPPPAPLVPEVGFRLGGTISGMAGPAMAASIASAVPYPGVSPELIKKCGAIVDHIQGNAEVEDGVIS